jgi:phosphoribosylformimino-5-aminoimidazole carboxamide ribonucleotide (ProFAR) isomerase
MFDCYDRLIEQYRDLSIVLSFKTILDKTKFQTWLTDISQRLELDLDIELSMKLWNNWHEHSQQCWTSTPLINRKNVYGQTWDKKITKN